MPCRHAFLCPAAARINRFPSSSPHKKRARLVCRAPPVYLNRFFGGMPAPAPRAALLRCPRAGRAYKSSPHARAKKAKNLFGLEGRAKREQRRKRLWVETDRPFGTGGRRLYPLFWRARLRAGAAAAALCAYAKALRVYFNALLLLKIQIDMLERRHLAHVAGDARVVV